MAANKALISAGDVIGVQLTSETVVIEGGGRRQVEPGHITNRMRLFVREVDGGEKKYDFEDTELGVRETQRVAIVRGKLKRVDDPVNLLLFNMSSGESDTFEPGLRAYLGHKPFFGPLAKAFFISIGTGIVLWLVAYFLYNQGPVTSGFFAGAAAFLLSPVFWWLCRTWDRITERGRYKASRKRFIKEMTARVAPYAAKAEAAPAATTPPSPEAPSPA